MWYAKSFITWPLTTPQYYFTSHPTLILISRNTKVLKILWIVNYFVFLLQVFLQNEILQYFAFFSNSPFPYNVYHETSNETSSHLLKTSRLLIAITNQDISLLQTSVIWVLLPFHLHTSWGKGQCVIYTELLRAPYKV